MKTYNAVLLTLLLILSSNFCFAQDFCTSLQSIVSAGKSNKFSHLKGNLVSENKTLSVAVYQSKSSLPGTTKNEIITDPDAPELNEFAAVLGSTSAFDNTLSASFAGWNAKLKACLKGYKLEVYDGNEDGTVDASGGLPDLAYSSSTSPILINLLITKSNSGQFEIRIEASIEEEE